MVDDKIQTTFQKYLKKDQKNDNQGYLSDIYIYLNFLDKDQEDSDNTEYLFNILKNIGYLAMSGFDIENNLINRTIKHLKEHKIPGRGHNAPSYINFDNLYSAINKYESMWNEFNRLIPITNIPKPGDAYDLKGQWDDMWWELYDSGLELILCGFDMEAIELGYEILNTTITNAIWGKSWNSFCENKIKFLSLLCQKEFEHRFYLISDDINKLLRKYYVCNKNNPFITFLFDVSTTRETYAEENYYSHIICSDEAKTIYQHIKHLFKGYPSGAWFSFYKCALAEITIKHFLIRICNALEFENTGIWNLTSSSANDYQYTHPVLIAGCNEYSVHMLSHPRNKGWGMLKTELESFFYPNRNDYKGAVFCSMKQYQSDNILVRFENYMSKEKLLRLYKMPEKEMLKDYYKFSFDDVYEKDKRKEFFQEAAKAVLGISEKNHSSDNVIKFPQQQIDFDDLFRGTQCADNYCDLAKDAGGGAKKYIKFKEMVEITIKETDQWKGLFSSFNRLIKDFKKLVDVLNGNFCYAAIIEYKNQDNEFIDINDLPDTWGTIEIRKDLSQDKNCKAVYLGITEDKNKNYLQNIIDSLKESDDKSKKPGIEKQKIIRWIKFNFKFNQTE